MHRNVELAVALARDGRHGYEVAALSKLNPNLFSGILTGREKPSAEQRRRIAAVLDVDPGEIFTGDYDDEALDPTNPWDRIAIDLGATA